jgi:DNA repair protein RadC
MSLAAHARTDNEVLAIVLGQGRSSGIHVDLAQALLARTGGLGGLAQASPAELLAVRGLGPRRASLVAAALELGRRSAGQRPERGQRLAAARDVFTHFRARLGSAPTEEFWVLGLDVRHRSILEACVARGSLTGVEVHPREVYRPLIRAAAAAVIFCHNHPSGDPTPSRQDFDLTARLKEVGVLCGITLLDHVVVAADGYVSLAERGWL